MTTDYRNRWPVKAAAGSSEDDLARIRIALAASGHPESFRLKSVGLSIVMGSRREDRIVITQLA
jgi:hypothetical protein